MEFCARDTEGKDLHFPCFFCQRCEIETNSRPSIKLSLSKIFNYLQLFPHDGKRRRLCYPSDEKLQNLSICEHCSQMAVEFSELYHLPEVTELRLNRCLERMQEVMSKIEPRTSKPIDKEEGPDLRTTMMGRIKEISELSHVDLRSRSQIVPNSISVMDHCSSTANSSISNEDSNEWFSSAGAKNWDIEANMECNEKKLFSPSPELVSKTEIASERVKKNKKQRAKTGTPSMADLTDSPQPQRQPQSRKKGKGDKKTCKFCYKSFQKSCNAQRHMKYYCSKGERLPPPSDHSLLNCAYCDFECVNRQDQMKCHLIRCHPEMFFQSERLDSSRWKEEHFNSIWMKIVLPKFILRKKNTSSTSCSCSVCGKKYCSDKGFPHNRSELRIHLINNHLGDVREHVKDTLGNGQSDTSLQKKLRIDTTLRKQTDERSGKQRLSDSSKETSMDFDEICASTKYEKDDGEDND